MVSSSARACSIVAPPASRPTTVRVRPPRAGRARSSVSGSHRSVCGASFSEPLLHDADDGGRSIVDGDDPSYRCRIRAEAALPQAMADDRDRRGPRRVVAGDEGAADCRRASEDLEDLRGRIRGGHLFGALVRGERRGCRRQGHHRFERARALCPIDEVRRRDTERRLRAVAGAWNSDSGSLGVVRREFASYNPESSPTSLPSSLSA